MQQNRDEYLLENLEQMPTWQLDDLLNRELTCPAPSGPNVRLILKVLREREKGQGRDSGPREDAAWEKYQRCTRKPEQGSGGKRALRVASVALALLVLLTLLPQQATARNFFERLVSWTDSVFLLQRPGDKADAAGEPVFRTDNPGLQQVYDAARELGVTQPVVPSWLPEGYVLTECRVIDQPSQTGLIAAFSDGNSEAVFTIDTYADNISRKYFKDDVDAEKFEFAGTIHYVTQNGGTWGAVWTRENVECSIYIECPEETLDRILRSVYIMEDE